MDNPAAITIITAIITTMMIDFTPDDKISHELKLIVHL